MASLLLDMLYCKEAEREGAALRHLPNNRPTSIISLEKRAELRKSAEIVRRQGGDLQLFIDIFRGEYSVATLKAAFIPTP